MDELKGYIERITFQNEESGYTVAQLQQKGRSQLVCIVGSLPSIQPGITVSCQGEWKNHLVHGKQFEVTSFRQEYPADLVGIEKYLGSGLIKGIGPVFAKKIVDTFGLETLNIIDKTPGKLLDIQGLGKKKLDRIATCWSEQRSIRDVMVFLQTYGQSPSLAQKIFRRFGDKSIVTLQTDPFCLARELMGVGFKSADKVAEKMGFTKTSKERIDAGIEYVLAELSGEGNVCYPLPLFLPAAAEMLEVELPLIEERLKSLKESGRIMLLDLLKEGEMVPFIWPSTLFYAEVGIAKRLKELLQTPSPLRTIDVFKALEWVQQQSKIELAEQQQQAVLQSLQEKVNIITGGPGTGKSTITKAILSIFEKLTPKILLLAPTGRAAKRMYEITGKKAFTIHSQLEYDFKSGQFKRNRDNPLDADVLIVDESSMIDTYLMHHLLKAIPDSAKVLFVGDIFQLPSVGPGNVLKDLIQSRHVAVTTLNQIFRQAQGSQIITNAHRINEGVFPDISPQTDSDFFFLEEETPEKLLTLIISLVKERVPRKYRFHPLDDIQVLSPMRKGVIGIDNLNEMLQEQLNPQQNPLYRMGRKYGKGDKVMQIRNNYQKEVFNGDIGRVVDIDQTEQQVVVKIDTKEVIYEFHELDELVLAYAVSVHKYQGSECPCVIIPVHTSHFKLLHRNLLYTGVTRGKKLVILVGTKKALAMGVRNNEVLLRYTGLCHALNHIFTPSLA